MSAEPSDGVRRTLAAVDIGGTFTDIVLVTSDGTLSAHKLPSTPTDYSAAVLRGLLGAVEHRGVSHGEVDEVRHATTVGTNAVLERKGALTALVTTLGFRDVLEIRRLRYPEVYNVQWEKPEPLVPRRLRLEMTERVASDGTVVTVPLRSELMALADRLRAEGVEAVAVAFINSYMNPEHERWVADTLAETLPGVAVTSSAALLPEMGEYERTSTAVANAYVAPTMQRYLTVLREALTAAGADAPLLVGQSNGGLFLHTFAAQQPYLTLESGPAAGCVAARSLARECGYGRVVSLDMGGTTAKASFIVNGELSMATELEVGAGMSFGGRPLAGGGYTIRAPAIDLAEVGAGGGSIAWVDEAGVLHVGPESAGAEPGPACYSLGGTRATLTDANVVLGYVNPDSLAGGALRLDASRAKAAIEDISAGLGLSVDETAYGIHVIANANTVGAIRAVSTQRGHDVRNADLVAFGGSGPVQAAEVAHGLHMRRVIVPPFAGLFSALGLLVADTEHHLVAGFAKRLDRSAFDELGRLFDRVTRDALAELGSTYQGSVEIDRFVSFRVADRTGEVTLPLPQEMDAAEVDRRVRDEYRRLFTHVPDGVPIEIQSIRVTARVAGPNDIGQLLQAASAPARELAVHPRRSVYLGTEHGRADVPVVSRASVARTPLAGPALVEDPDSSMLVLPGWEARLDDWGNLVAEEVRA